MDLALKILLILLVIANVFLYIDFRRFLKRHENDLVEKAYKGLMFRTVITGVLTACMAITAAAIHFIK